MHTLPVSGRVAWWATAWLRGRTVTDLALDAVAADGRLHCGPGGEPLVELLGRLRAAGATDCGLALPVEGDPLGLGGPRELNDLALEHGEAVVAPAAGLALVPDVGTEVVTWRLLPAARRQLPDVGETDRALRRAIIETANDLAALDVARWRPEAADLLMGPDRREPLPAPEGTPARCVELAGRALSAAAIVDVALADDGAAVSVGEIARRRAALDPLERASRRALVAACSPEVWPPG
ncbi:hypothetical protein EXE57_01520 [Nocardioides euryhalodurans]|uniref:Uncharacterized protein n=1 Tax=Nocardioides euryhalodurans TaxID=2518370 RepID=A0A4P7GQY7_9ACTN|nr:hypothetical protein EXE57_01520 [Nocardioides euryhalodurans]